MMHVTLPSHYIGTAVGSALVHNLFCIFCLLITLSICFNLFDTDIIHTFSLDNDSYFEMELVAHGPSCYDSTPVL